MNELMTAIANYLNNSNIPPNLAVKVEVNDSDLLKTMIDMGFVHQGEFWVIGKERAKEALMAHLGIQKPFDWDKHWQQERRRKLGN